MRGLACWLPLYVLGAGALAAQPAPAGLHLPGNVVPLKYTAELRIDPSLDTFEGSISIQVHINQVPIGGVASSVWLHGKDLVPGTVELIQGETHVRGLSARPVAGELIEIQGVQLSGDAIIRMDYRGHIDDKAVVGAYRRKIDGRWYVYTTFTPIEARRVFPCFDELTYKVPWEISIRVPAGNRVFSNAPESEPAAPEREPSDPQWFRFEATKPLPAELIAFAVGPFDVYEKPRVDGEPPMRVITPKGRGAEGKAAAESAAILLPRLEAYTGIPYAFGKLDHLAMADGGFSAVENPGLIVYLDKQLLLPPGTETPANTRSIRFLEAHEMGHQWFGDLVTQADWNDLWLSEGFATWIADKMMDQEEPPRRAHLAGIIARERIMQVDGSAKTHPVRMEVRSREDSLELYNRITYDKGASVLTMLEGWLGEEMFHAGVRGYLRDHRLGSGATQDLADELKRASGTDPSAVMHSFLDGTGVPRVQAQVQCERTPRLIIRQTGAAAIPICYRGDGVSPTCVELDGPSREVDLKSCPSWIYLNAGGTGYYRTSWEGKPLAALPLEQLTPAERLTLVFDLNARKNAGARAALDKLQMDSEPEIAQAAREALR